MDVFSLPILAGYTFMRAMLCVLYVNTKPLTRSSLNVLKQETVQDISRMKGQTSIPRMVLSMNLKTLHTSREGVQRADNG